MSKLKRIAIVGGGISGLTAAYKLLRQARELDLNIEIDLYDAKELGGVFKTIEEKNCRLECGPDSFFTKTPEVLELAKELEISEQIIPTNEKQRKSLVAKDNELIPLPDGFVMIAPSKVEPFMQTELISQSGKERALQERDLAPRSSEEEETVAQFVERRFGKEMLSKIVQPMVGGIYTGDVNKLSAEACLPEFVEMERTKGSIINALSEKYKNDGAKSDTKSETKGARYSAFYSFKNGMSYLIEKLNQKIAESNGVTIKTAESVHSIKKASQGQWKLLTESGDQSSYDALILALGASALSKIMSDLSPDISLSASGIDCASSCVVNLIFEKADIEQSKLDGFGFVVPEESKRELIACSYLSVKFEHRSPEQKVILRAFLGGVQNEGILKESDAKIIQLVLEELEYFLNIKNKPLYTSISRWQDAMPQYTIGHQDRIMAITKRLEDFPGIYITGNFISGVGIPKCVELASKAAFDVAQFLKVPSTAKVID